MASSFVEDRSPKADDEQVDFDGEGVKDALLSFRGSEDRETDEGATGVFWENRFTGSLEDLGITGPGAGIRCVTVLTITRLED